MNTPSDDARIRRLLDVGTSVVAELDMETVLHKVLEEARSITGARYAALGVLDEHRDGLERFLTAGVDAETHRAIGDLPRGRGVLGVLIEIPRPLRLADVGKHPQSYGFPAGHPVMRSFLGVPVVIRGQAWGNLYLTEKHGGGEFTESDEDAAVALARWAAIAIENARLYATSESRRAQLERAVQSLEAARDVTHAIGGEDSLDRVLELIVKRGRALVSARSVLIMLREGDELVVSASAGQAADARGRRVKIAGSTSGHVLKRGVPQRIADVTSHLTIGPEKLGVPDARTALLVPMLHRGEPVGVLAAFDHGEESEVFSADDELLLRTFAQSAANAVAIRRSVEADRLRAAIAAADSERSRWARELHDQTLQALGGLRVILASARGRPEVATKDQAISQAIEDIELEIGNLRGIITDLRPSLLDDLGLRPALEALLDRRREAGLEIASELRLPDPALGEAELTAELETTIYRLVQEALTNVVKHAQATHVSVSVSIGDDKVIVEVSDDGVGFDAAVHTRGFGLAGMRERVYLSGGTIQVESNHAGTVVRARLPTVRSGEGGTRSASGQPAS